MKIIKIIKTIIDKFTIRTSQGQKIRMACAIIGVSGAVFAFMCIPIIRGIIGFVFDQTVPSTRWEDLVGTTVALTLSFLICCLCGRYIVKNDIPGPDGWGEPIIKKSEALKHPDILWAIRQILDSGYIKEGQTVYFTTLRDIMARSNVEVNATQIRSVLQADGCQVMRDTVREGDLRDLFMEMDKQNNGGE